MPLHFGGQARNRLSGFNPSYQRPQPLESSTPCLSSLQVQMWSRKPTDLVGRCSRLEAWPQIKGSTLITGEETVLSKHRAAGLIPRKYLNFAFQLADGPPPPIHLPFFLSLMHQCKHTLLGLNPSSRYKNKQLERNNWTVSVDLIDGAGSDPLSQGF